LHQEGIRKALIEIGQEVVSETKRLIRTGNRTGRQYSFRGRIHIASSPTEAPANRSGRLARSGGYKVSGPYQMVVGEKVEYAKFLEDGTKKMKARPHLIVAINNKARDTQSALIEHGINGIKYK